MQISSCVIPFIYAATIPDFNRIVRDIFYRNLFDRMRTRMTTTFGKSEDRGTNTASFSIRRDEQNPEERVEIASQADIVYRTNESNKNQH